MRSTLEALVSTEGDWCASRLGVLVERGQPVPGAVSAVWRTRRAHTRPKETGWAVAAIADRIADWRARPVLWHETDPDLALGIGSARRTIITAYDLIPLVEPSVLKSMRPDLRIPIYLHARRMKGARAIVAISHTTADDLRRVLGVPRERIHVIYPPVPRAPTDRPPAPNGIRPLLFVGVAAPHKRADLAVDTLAALRPRSSGRRLVVVGRQPGHLQARLLRLARDKGVADAIDFLGQVGDAQLRDLYRRCTLLALSTHEGFGLPPVESVLAGGTVVAVRRPIYLEVIGTVARFSPREDAEAIAQTIIAADGFAPSEAEVSALALRVAPETIARSLIELYERVAG